MTVFNFTLFEITGVVVSDNAHELLFLKFFDIIVEHPGFLSNQRIMVFDIISLLKKLMILEFTF